MLRTGDQQCIYSESIHWSQKSQGAGKKLHRFSIVAYHVFMKHKDKVLTGVVSDTEFQSVSKRALRWRHKGHEDIKINATTNFFDQQMPASQQISPTLAATPCIKATSRHLATAPDEIANLNVTAASETTV